MTETTNPADVPENDTVDVPTPTPVDPITSTVIATAEPVDVDVVALLKQVQAMQEEIIAMRVARGMPSDPLAAAVQNLRDHVNARAIAHPNMKDQLAELKDAVNNLPDVPTTNHTDLVRTVIDDFGTYLEGLEYIKELAKGLHKLVLKKDLPAPVPAKA